MSKYICSRTNYNKVDMHINIWVMSINIGPRRNYKIKNRRLYLYMSRSIETKDKILGMRIN
jgi:hypothetical protein